VMGKRRGRCQGDNGESEDGPKEKLLHFDYSLVDG
jgi:hypothetical protein